MRKRKKVIVVGLALLLIIVMVITTSVKKFNTNTYLSMAYEVLYLDEEIKTPEPDNYTDDPCQCISLSKELVSNNNNNNNQNTGASGQSAETFQACGGRDNNEKLWNYLCGYYNEIVASGIMANIYFEGANTGAGWNADPLSNVGQCRLVTADSSSGLGIVQWTNVGGRKQKIKDWIKSKYGSGKETDLDAQLAAMRWEIHERGHDSQWTKYSKKKSKTYFDRCYYAGFDNASHYEACSGSYYFYSTVDGVKKKMNMRELRGYVAWHFFLKYNSLGVRDKGQKGSITTVAESRINGGISLTANAAKKDNKNDSKSSTGNTIGSGGVFKTPNFDRPDYKGLVMYLLPSAVACREYWGIDIISQLAQSPWEGSWDRVKYGSGIAEAKKKGYSIYGLIGVNKFTGKYWESPKHKFRTYSDYEEAVVDHARNFFVKDKQKEYKPFRDALGKGYEQEILALAKTGYLGDGEDRNVYVNNILGTAKKLDKYAKDVGGDFSDIDYCKKCIEAWNLTDSYNNALKWINKYESKFGKTAKGNKISGISGNSGGKLDISDLDVAKKLLNFTNASVDDSSVKTSKKLTFDYTITKCTKVKSQNYISDRLGLTKVAQPFNAKGLNAVCVHHTAGGATGLSNMDTNPEMFFGGWNDNGQNLGSHFGISGTGKIYQYLSIDKKCAAQNDANGNAIGIEVGDDKPDYEYSQQTYESLVHLVAYLSVELNLDIACGFVNAPKSASGTKYWDKNSGLIRHYDASRGGAFRGKGCPLAWTPKDGSNETNEKNTKTGKKMSNTRWITFKADVYRYIANYKDDENFKIEGIEGLDKAKILAQGNKHQFSWDNVSSLLNGTQTSSNGSTDDKNVRYWLCNCKIPCDKCHCHDNETNDSVIKGIGNSNTGGSSGNNSGNSDNNSDEGLSGEDEVIEAIKKVDGELTKVVTKEITAGRMTLGDSYNQSGFSKVKIDGKEYTIRRDCSGTVSAMLWVLGDLQSGIIWNSELFRDNTNLKNWTKHTIDSSYKPKRGDILAYRRGTHGHVEVFDSMSDGKLKVWNWGGYKCYVHYSSSGMTPTNSSNTLAQYQVYWRRNTVK